MVGYREVLVLMMAVSLAFDVQHFRHERCWRLRASPAEASDKDDELRNYLLEIGAKPEEIKLRSRLDEARSIAVSKHLVACGFLGSDVAQMLSSCPSLSTCEASSIDAALDFLTGSLGLKMGEVRRVVKSKPTILLGRPPSSGVVVYDTGACPAVLGSSRGGGLEDAVDLLKAVGVRDKHLKEMVVRWPQLLEIELPQMLAVTDYLSFHGFKSPLGPLYRQAPWLLAVPLNQVRPSVDFLLEECGIVDLEKVIRGYPRCLIAEPSKMTEHVKALRSYGVVDQDLGRLVESFPLIFGLSPQDMDSVVEYWRDIGVAPEDVARICRAFPSLLGVRVDAMKQSVSFLREIGVNNIARFVTRLPPVLAYDVDTVLKPKMQFAVYNSLSIYDVVRFPAYFSYPLDSVIQPRTDFIKQFTKGKVTLAGLGLNVVLTPSDADFAKLIRASPQAYAQFKQEANRAYQAENRQLPKKIFQAPSAAIQDGRSRASRSSSSSPNAKENDKQARSFPKMSRPERRPPPQSQQQQRQQQKQQQNTSPSPQASRSLPDDGFLPPAVP